jgi:hypothetical protein
LNLLLLLAEVAVQVQALIMWVAVVVREDTALL